MLTKATERSQKRDGQIIKQLIDIFGRMQIVREQMQTAWLIYQGCAAQASPALKAGGKRKIEATMPLSKPPFPKRGRRFEGPRTGSVANGAILELCSGHGRTCDPSGRCQFDRGHIFGHYCGSPGELREVMKKDSRTDKHDDEVDVGGRNRAFNGQKNNFHNGTRFGDKP